MGLGLGLGLGFLGLGCHLLARMMQCSSSDSEKMSPPASYAMVLK